MHPEKTKFPVSLHLQERMQLILKSPTVAVLAANTLAFVLATGQRTALGVQFLQTRKFANAVDLSKLNLGLFLSQLRRSLLAQVQANAWSYVLYVTAIAVSSVRA